MNPLVEKIAGRMIAEMDAMEITRLPKALLRRLAKIAYDTLVEEAAALTREEIAVIEKARES